MNFILKTALNVWSIFHPMKVYGKENIPEGGAVLVCNHFRGLDCAFIARVFDDGTKYLAKKEIFKNKLFTKVLRAYGGIPIDRDKPDMKSLLEAIKEIKKGNKLCIFPEGHRNVTGTNVLQEIKAGTVVFSIKAKCPIVPIMMLNKFKAFKKTHLIIGEPFEFSEYYGKKLTEEDLKELTKILRAKMIEQHQILKNIVLKGKKEKC